MGYKDIEIEAGKAPADYTYHERRSELLRFIIEAGHPDMISRKKFAERYDVHSSTITRDIQAIREEVHEDLSSDAQFISSIIYRKAIREKADEGKWMEAKELLESWNEWLEDRGEQTKEAEKVEMDLDASVKTDERKAFVGVNLDSFAGVDADQMVGLDLGDIDEDANAGPAELDVEAVETDE